MCVCVCVCVIGHIMAKNCMLFSRCQLEPKEVEALNLTVSIIGSECTE
jgi:hypothetical protein